MSTPRSTGKPCGEKAVLPKSQRTLFTPWRLGRCEIRTVLSQCVVERYRLALNGYGSLMGSRRARHSAVCPFFEFTGGFYE